MDHDEEAGVEELVTIGTFARMAQLSTKALRHYDALGLLRPAAVDSDSGYRYYRPAQVERARLIAWLRQLGLPLTRIGEAFAFLTDALRSEREAPEEDPVPAAG